MPLSELIQRLIHMLEAGAGSRYLRFLVLGLAVMVLALVYNLRAYRNLATQEAMDSAQLARNIADGKGYTTLFIRPFSLYLVQSHNEAKHVAAPAITMSGSLCKRPTTIIASTPSIPLRSSPKIESRVIERMPGDSSKKPVILMSCLFGESNEMVMRL